MRLELFYRKIYCCFRTYPWSITLIVGNASYVRRQIRKNELVLYGLTGELRHVDICGEDDINVWCTEQIKVEQITDIKTKRFL